eukprot:7977363-Pyramimonas_sp.AAC.1
MAIGVFIEHVAQRHQMILPNRELPFCLDMGDIHGCTWGYKLDNATYLRPDVIKVATQLGSTDRYSRNERPLDTDAIHAAPPGLQEL